MLERPGEPKPSANARHGTLKETNIMSFRIDPEMASTRSSDEVLKLKMRSRFLTDHQNVQVSYILVQIITVKNISEANLPIY